MNNLSKLFLSIIMTQLVGLAGVPITTAAIPSWYATLNRPFFSPPNYLFGPVWTVLYFLMGLSFYLIWSKGLTKPKAKLAAQYFFAQLALNFCWTPIFFGLRSPELALIVIVAMEIMIFITIKRFYPLSKTASYLLIPYLVWVSFATLLNTAIVILN